MSPAPPRTGVAVKICGVCTPEDAALATSAGADYLGVILAPGRTRSRSLSQAAAIFGDTTARRAGVFVDAAPAEVLAAAAELNLDVVQLHGDETAEQVEAVRNGAPPGLRIWKAVRVREAADIVSAGSMYAGRADALLLDGWSPAGHGGVGARFDWEAAAVALKGLHASLKVVAAGGLGPDNVAHVIALLRPAVVDVSSGVEESPCRKSAERVHGFIEAARNAGTEGYG
jgi:phosphoribosylanthranilate isomerase